MNREKLFLHAGRPPKSKIRDNIAQLLHYLKSADGYFLHKVYTEVFGKVSLRSIYYHLKKGCEIGLFKIKEIKEEKGDYSWGEYSRKVKYELMSKKFLKEDKKIRNKIMKVLKVLRRKERDSF